LSVVDTITSQRRSGVAVPLWSLRLEGDCGTGEFRHLVPFGDWCAATGLDLIQLLPIHDSGTNTSPYSAVSAFALNPIYLDLSALPGSDEIGEDISALQKRYGPRETLAYGEIRAEKLDLARRLFDGAEEPDLDAWLVTQPWVRPYAAYVVLKERNEMRPWWEWSYDAEPSSSLIDGIWDDEATGATCRFLAWLQYHLHRQLDAAVAALKERKVYLKGDVPILMSRDSADVWWERRVFDLTYQAGAPPDMFSEDGQNWQLAAPSPVALRETDFAPYRAMIAAQLQDAGALRIDHAMALWQLFLIPRDAPAAAGTHLRFPLADMLRVLAEASQSHQALIIGEDLGFVPDGFRDSMQKAGVLSYRIVYFEKSAEGFAPAETYPQLALACLSTHDLPPLTGWWDGIDIDLREAHGLVSKAKQLARTLGVAAPDADALLDAAHRFIAATPSVLAGVRLADLVGPARPTNLPGVTDGYPNWKPRSPVSIDQIAAHPRFARIARIMRYARPRPQ